MPSSVSSFVSRLSGRGPGGKEFNCTVQLLDDGDNMNITFKKNDIGQTILDKVCEHVQLVERDYFGLRYMDMNKHRYWLDPTKPIYKQIHHLNPMVFSLRVRYYPTDPSVIKEELTRYQLFLQLRRDMLHGRLYCPNNDAAYLGGCILQSEIGDYNPREHKEGYASEFKLFLKQTAKVEERVAEEHKTMKHDRPCDSEMKFLERTSTLDTYGFDPYTVKDNSTGNSVYVGFTPNGLMVYHMNRKTHHVPYEKVAKVDYAGKEFRVYVTDQEERKEEGEDHPAEQAVDVGDLTDAAIEATEGMKTVGTQANTEFSEENTLRFTCPSGTFAKHLWKYALSQRAFFTNDAASDVKPQTASNRIPLFVRGSTFRYSGRVLHEIVDGKIETRTEPVSFVRNHVERQPGRSERSYPYMKNGAATLPRSKKEENQVADNEKENCTPVSATEDLHVTTTSAEELVEEARSEDSPIMDIEQPDLSPTRIVNTPPPSPTAESNDEGAPPPPSCTKTKMPHIKTSKATVIMSRKDVIPNGTADHSTKESQCDPQGMCARVCHSILTLLLVTLLLTAIIVAIMEIPSLRSSVDSVPYMSEFRHEHYEPLKGIVVKHYNDYRHPDADRWI